MTLKDPTYSCTIEVTAVQGEDFGALATVDWVQPSVGIDVSLRGPTQIQITEDAATIVQVGKQLILTLSPA